MRFQPEVFAGTYGVELLCAAAPDVTAEMLLEGLRQHCGSVEAVGDDMRFAHADFPVDEDGTPAQTCVVVADEPPGPGTLTAAVQQSHSFPGAEAALAATRATVLVTDVMSAGLHPVHRMRFFHEALMGVLEVVRCLGIHWRRAERVVDVEVYREIAAADDGARRLGAGPVNVRMFNVAGRTDGAVLMDTMGLGALGLPDLQCLFRGLHPNDVATVLYNAAWYVFSKGDVLRDGDTVEGVGGGSRWECRGGNALVAPSRPTITLQPTLPHRG